MMDDTNISSATSTSQISSLLLGQRLSSAAASISSSSSPASSVRGVPDDHWARQMVFSPFAGHRQPTASHLRPCSGGAVGTAAEGGGDVGTAVSSLGFDPAALLQGGAKMCAADFDPYDGESEEGAEASEEQRRPPPRSGSKRSRAAEVHNLSEKRRRSRINEKMKALQNLIPNSNKTDKASMLDEAIEYLKQLQLQVQMLSMRNGLSLQPMYLPRTLPALQSSHIRMGLTPDGGSLINMGVDMMPANQDSSVHGASSQQHMMPTVAAIPSPVASLGIESSQFHPFRFSVPHEEIFEQSRVDADHGDGNIPGAIAGRSGQSQGGGMHVGKQWKA